MLSISRKLLKVIFSAFCFAAVSVGHAAEVAPSQGLLTLINGNTIPGEFRPSEASDAIRWQGSAFTQPFEFLTNTISSIQFPAVQPPAKQKGEFAVELVRGDVVTGRIVNWNEQEIALESPYFGLVHLRSDAVRRLYRIDGNPMLVFPGLSGLADWKGTGVEWKEDGPHVWTEQTGAVLTGHLKVPEKAVIEFELSWTKKPNFVFAVGVDSAARIDRRVDGWRFEAWDGVLTVLREQRDIADVDRVMSLLDYTKRVHLIAYLDQVTGQMQVFHPDGTPAGEISVPPGAAGKDKPSAEAGQGVRLINRHGDIRIERLRIARWSGLLPSSSEGAKCRLELADGTTVKCDTIQIEPETQKFAVHRGDEVRHLEAKDLIGAELSPMREPAPRSMAAILQDGTRVLGKIESVRPDALVVSSPDITEPLQVPHAELRSLTVSEQGDLSAVPAPDGRVGRLEVGEYKLAGRLVPATEENGGSCLAWHPIGSRTSSTLKPDLSGRVVYRDPPPSPSPSSRLQQRTVEQPGQNFFNLFVKKAGQAAAKPIDPGSHRIHLRSGDIIPGTIESIGENGVVIDSTISDARIIPHVKIKAIELTNNGSVPSLKTAKKERLLTLPRLQKASPPTHLLCSRTGDFLRCRIIEMKHDYVRVEVQLEEIEIPTERVAQIIWFHPDELESEEGKKDQAEKEPGEETENAPAMFSNMAQVLQPNGNRVTFDPKNVDAEAISGVSEVLGPCKFNISDIDQLIFGQQINVDVMQLAYHKWRLQPAIEPLVAQDLGPDASEVGSISPLVGKPAPEIDLELLDGTNFKLSRCKGQVVVLDFWATWCGPCMETMPLLEAAMHEFDATKVRLVSVNLEEPADHIKGVLERHKMNVTVALDIDGVAARRYEANAIPQLVVIDKEGNVARLYVGGGPNVVEELKTVLAEMLKESD